MICQPPLRPVAVDPDARPARVRRENRIVLRVLSRLSAAQEVRVAAQKRAAAALLRAVDENRRARLHVEVVHPRRRARRHPGEVEAGQRGRERRPLRRGGRARRGRPEAAVGAVERKVVASVQPPAHAARVARRHHVVVAVVGQVVAVVPQPHGARRASAVRPSLDEGVAVPVADRLPGLERVCGLIVDVGVFVGDVEVGHRPRRRRVHPQEREGRPFVLPVADVDGRAGRAANGHPRAVVRRGRVVERRPLQHVDLHARVHLGHARRPAHDHRRAEARRHRRAVHDPERLRAVAVVGERRRREIKRRAVCRVEAHEVRRRQGAGRRHRQSVPVEAGPGRQENAHRPVRRQRVRHAHCSAVGLRRVEEAARAHGERADDRLRPRRELQRAARVELEAAERRRLGRPPRRVPPADFDRARIRRVEREFGSRILDLCEDKTRVAFRAVAPPVPRGTRRHAVLQRHGRGRGSRQRPAEAIDVPAAPRHSGEDRPSRPVRQRQRANRLRIGHAPRGEIVGVARADNADVAPQVDDARPLRAVDNGPRRERQRLPGEGVAACVLIAAVRRRKGEIPPGHPVVAGGIRREEARGRCIGRAVAVERPAVDLREGRERAAEEPLSVVRVLGDGRLCVAAQGVRVEAVRIVVLRRQDGIRPLRGKRRDARRRHEARGKRPCPPVAILHVTVPPFQRASTAAAAPASCGRAGGP